MGRDPFAEVIAIERFRARLREERMPQQPLDRPRVHPPRRRSLTVGVACSTAARAHEIIDQRVRRTRIAGDRILLAIDEGDVGDAAEIKHHDRMRPGERAHERAMVRRDERRALPAARHIGRAKVINHGNASLTRQRGAVAELDGQFLRGPVQDRLPVIADERNVACSQPRLRRQKCVHRARVQGSGDFLGLGDHSRPLGAPSQGRRLFHGAAQDRGLVLPIRMKCARPEARDCFAIRLNQCDIDAVHRRAAHQPDRPHATQIL